jgi:hypothetical protein
VLPITFGDGDIFGRDKPKRIPHRLVFVLCALRTTNRILFPAQLFLLAFSHIICRPLNAETFVERFICPFPPKKGMTPTSMAPRLIAVPLLKIQSKRKTSVLERPPV